MPLYNPVGAGTPILYSPIISDGRFIGTSQFDDIANFTVGLTAGQSNIYGNLFVNGAVSLGAYTFMSLPDPAIIPYGVAILTDSDIPVAGNTASGGGSFFALVVSNGTNWVWT
jgi:hypothetical protein